MKKESIKKIFHIWEKRYENEPRIELEYKNPYTLLVAVILSAQSTDKGVNKATKALFEKVDTPEKMVALGEDNLKKYVKTIGLYNTKSKNIIKMSQDLIDKHNSKVPSTLEDLVNLAGVGRKTANIILNCVYDIPAIGVDTHVFRVSNRIGLVKTKNVLETEKALMQTLPKKWILTGNHWMVLHGRYICKSRKPMCPECPIREYCEYKDKTE